VVAGAEWWWWERVEKKNRSKRQIGRFTRWWALGGRQHCFVVAGAEQWWWEKAEGNEFGGRVKRENKNETRWASFVSFFFVFFFFFNKRS